MSTAGAKVMHRIHQGIDILLRPRLPFDQCPRRLASSLLATLTVAAPDAAGVRAALASADVLHQMSLAELAIHSVVAAHEEIVVQASLLPLSLLLALAVAV